VNPDEPVVGKSGVRQYVRRTPWHAIRRQWVLRNVSHVGSNVYVDRNVRVLRHPENVTIGSEVILKEGVRICPTNPRARISIGAWTTVGYHTFVFAMTQISIAEDCLIAPFCYFVDNEHDIEPGEKIRTQPMRARPIRVGAGAWLGTGVTVTAGVTIGAGAVIGARAVVTEDVPEGAIAVGVPARVVRFRSS
jgi:acetyltransferase-like isoleucine patch superfamily enzyme